jgi:voltage-gated potassium channel Kch
MEPDSKTGDYHLHVSKDLSNRLAAFVRAANGFPSSLDGNFWRLMYFSLVTITTLGYGDILPLSNVARGLVAAEAILGIVVIGLFLNSLARQDSSGQSTLKSTG